MNVSYAGQSLKCVKVTTLGPRTLQQNILILLVPCAVKIHEGGDADIFTSDNGYWTKIIKISRILNPHQHINIS